MDIKISQEVIKQRRKRRIIKISVITGCLIVVFILLISLLKPSIRYDQLNICQVDRGDLNVSIAATGKVVPLYEEVLVSPVSSKIVSVFKKSGEQLKENDSILELDLVAFKTDIEKQLDQLEIKRSQIEQEQLSIASNISNLGMQIKIDEMKLKRMQALLTNEHYLDSIGASTKDKIRQVKLDYEVQTLQLEQMKLNYENTKKIAEAKLKVLKIEYKIAEKNIGLLQKTSQEAQMRAPRDATLTWVNDQIGANVAAGSQLAILSDLNNFKISGEVSDSYANKISVGNAAEVKIGTTILKGIIENVVPSVNDGKISFTVSLEEKDHEQLRPGLSVDIYVVSSIKSDVLRITNQSYYSGPGEYELWVIQDSKAEKRNVRLGENSFDKVEVIDGLQEGETVIVSNMNQYQDQTTIRVRY